MNTTPQRLERKRLSAGWLVVVLPALYVFSVGPACALHEKGFLPDAILDTYTPVYWLADQNETAGLLFRQWVYLWFGLFGVPW